MWFWSETVNKTKAYKGSLIKSIFLKRQYIYIFIRQKAEETSEKKATDTQQQQQQQNTKNTVKAGELVNTCLKN